MSEKIDPAAQSDGSSGPTPLLFGVRVLDLTAYLPGPYASLLFADLGADVIAIEPRGGEAGRGVEPQVGGDSALHAWVGRNKRSIGLDLKEPGDYAQFKELLGGADIVLEGFTPGVAERLQVDYLRCSATKPDIVYCSIAGYLTTGGPVNTPGHDINFVARSGFLAEAGDRTGRPATIGPPIADIAGGLHAAVGLLAALLRRERTGLGCKIDISILRSAIALTGPQLVKALAPNNVPADRDFNRGADPAYRAYQAQDGHWLVLGALEEKFWGRFCTTIRRPELIPERSAHPNDVALELEALFATEPRAHWDALLEHADVCYSPVRAAADVCDDAHIVADRAMVQVGAVWQPATAIRVSGVRSPADRPAGPVGRAPVTWHSPSEDS